MSNLSPIGIVNMNFCNLKTQCFCDGMGDFQLSSLHHLQQILQCIEVARVGNILYVNAKLRNTFITNKVVTNKVVTKLVVVCR